MGLFDDPGAILGNPQGPFMQFAPSVVQQIPVLDYSSAAKATRPSGARRSGGRSQDAGTHQLASSALAGSQGQAASQRAMAPLQLYGQQADMGLEWADLANQQQGLQIGAVNAFMQPFLGSVLSGLGNIMQPPNIGNIKI